MTQKEQQKIADDDLRPAQAEKKETLKLHKKGLMQGLFPVVGRKGNEGYLRNYIMGIPQVSRIAIVR